MSSALTFDEADILLDEISVFLKRKGGPYTEITGELQTCILLCMKEGQYKVWRDGGITDFACYFLVNEVESVKQNKWPKSITEGHILYLCHGAGNPRKVISYLRNIRKHICWMRHRDRTSKGVWHEFR